MNKKGFKALAEETFEGLIGVICLVFLGILLVSLFFFSQTNTKMTQAEGVLLGDNGLMNIINSGEDNNDFKILNPVGWAFLGFTESMPDSCNNEKCICICDYALFTNNQIKKCNKDGVCLNVKNLKEEFKSKIEVNNPLSISIINSDEGVEIKIK